MGKQRIKEDPIKQYDSFFQAATENKKRKFNSGLGSVASSKTVGFNTGFGDSDYDKNLSWNAEVDTTDQNSILKTINEHRANEQSGLTQLAEIIPRAGVKAATEVAKLAPIIYGVGKAIFEDNKTSTLEDIFNNEGIKALDEMNQTINTELLPVYVKDSVKNGTLMDNLMSTSFYATEGADGLGFMASMFAPGMILKGMSLGSKLVGGLSKVSKLTKMVEGTEGSVQVLKGLGWTGRALDSKIAVLANSLIEAGSESKGVQDNLTSEKEAEIQKYMSSGMSEDQAKGFFDQKHPDWDTNVANAMKGDFWTQLPMLLGTGSMMQKAIFGKALDKVEKTVEYGLKGRVGSLGKQWGKALLSEGLIEEGGQSTLEKYYTKKALSGDLKNGWTNALSLGDMSKEYVDTISTVEGQKAVFLGALMGGPSMSMEARREYKKGLKDTNNITNGVNSSIDDYNTIRENDIYEKDPNDNNKPLFKKDSNGNLTTEKVLNRKKALDVALALKNTEEDDDIYNDALKGDDVELQKFIQNRNILKLIAPAIQNGELGLKILKEQLEQSSKFTDIAEGDKNNKDESTSNKNLVKQILEKAKYLQEQNEKFKDFAPDIIKLDDPRGTKEVNENYLNHLNSKYIEVKALQYDAENKLDNLNKKKENILNELNINPELSSQNILDNGRLLQDYKNKSPLLVKVLNEINKTNSEISKHKEDINDFWDNKSNIINDAFSSHLDGLDIKTKDTSEENVQKASNLINNIDNATEEEHLDKILKDDKDYFNDPYNQVVKSKLEQKRRDIITKKKADLEIKKKAEEEENIRKQQESPNNGTKDGKVNKGKPLEKVTESIQNSQTSDVDHNGEDYEATTANPKELEIIPDKIESKGTRLNSTVIHTKDQINNPERYPKLKKEGEPIGEAYAKMVEYEQQPRDKKQDNVSFSIGNFEFAGNDKVENIYKKLLNKETLSDSEIKILEDYLPIKVTLTHGKESANSFLDSMSHSEKNRVEKETLPLRKAIVSVLITNNGSFDKISGKVNDQFPGVLQIADQMNNIFDLQFMDKMSEEQKIIYFQEEAGYVDWEGVYKNCKSGKSSNDKPIFSNDKLKGTDPSRHKGEVFLKIPMNNGKSFFLKLNTNKISESKANALFNLMKIKFELEKDNTHILSLSKYIEGKPEYSTLLEDLINEIEFVKHNSDKLLNQTVNQLIDLLILNGNENQVTKFGLYFNNSTIVGNKGELYEGSTGVSVGTLFNKIYDETHDLPKNTNLFRTQITAEEFLANPEQFQEAFVKFFQYKRHNVLFNGSNGVSFKNKNYINYLIKQVLSTNANTEHTFGGYSNIYLEPTIKHNNEVVEVEKKPITTNAVFSGKQSFSDNLSGKKDLTGTETSSTESEIEAKKADIERRRQEELKNRVIYDRFPTVADGEFQIIGDPNNRIFRINENTGRPQVLDESNGLWSNTEESPNMFMETTKRSGFQKSKDKINAKYDAELAELENNAENIRKSENNSVSLSNNIQFTHQIDGTEENKKVKEMESKIESKQLNLSEDKIMDFVEEDGFGLLIERYSQEKGIKEENLTTEDYNKIIESNYTKEQIDKICKN